MEKGISHGHTDRVYCLITETLVSPILIGIIIIKEEISL